MLYNVYHLTSNRYIEEHVQRTAVAIETQGFTLITSGKKRESLTVSGLGKRRGWCEWCDLVWEVDIFDGHMHRIERP